RLPVADGLPAFCMKVLSRDPHHICGSPPIQTSRAPVAQSHRDPSDELSFSGVGMADDEVKHLPSTCLASNHPFCELLCSFIQVHLILRCGSLSPRPGLRPGRKTLPGQGIRWYRASERVQFTRPAEAFTIAMSVSGAIAVAGAVSRALAVATAISGAIATASAVAGTPAGSRAPVPANACAGAPAVSEAVYQTGSPASSGAVATAIAGAIAPDDVIVPSGAARQLRQHRSTPAPPGSWESIPRLRSNRFLEPAYR